METTDEIVGRLRQHPTSSGLDEHSLKLIASRAEIVNVDAGELLHRSGESVDRILLIDSGRLRLEVVVGETNTPVSYLSAEQQFGLLSVFKDFAAPVDLVADTPSTVLAISRTDVRALSDRLPLWRRNLVHALGLNAQALLPSGTSSRKTHRTSALIHFRPQTRIITRELARRLGTSGTAVVLYTDEPASIEFPSDHVTVKSIASSSEICLAISNIKAQQNQSDPTHVIFALSVDSASVALDPLLDVCDRAYALAQPNHTSTSEDWFRHIRDARQNTQNVRRVLCLSAEESVAPLEPNRSAESIEEIKVHLPEQGASERLVQLGISRLLHDACGVRLGIALGGGAARGMAHLGVLQTLEEAGIFCDAIAGTSVGAMVGIVHAGGIAPEAAARCFANDLTPSPIEQKIPGGDGLYLLRKYRTQGWDSMLRVYLHDWCLEQLPIPVTSVSVDLVSGQQVHACAGDAVHAILDSINLPGLSPPICRDGKALVDGGVLNVLPADVLVQNYKCDYVIAVDVGSKLSEEFVGNRPDTATSEMNTPGIFQTLMRSMNVQNRDLRNIRSCVSDITIEPHVENTDAEDFKHAVEIAAIGREAANEMLPSLREQLSRIHPALLL